MVPRKLSSLVVREDGFFSIIENGVFYYLLQEAFKKIFAFILIKTILFYKEEYI